MFVGKEIHRLCDSADGGVVFDQIVVLKCWIERVSFVRAADLVKKVKQRGVILAYRMRLEIGGRMRRCTSICDI